MRLVSLSVLGGSGVVTEGLLVPPSGALTVGNKTLKFLGASPGQLVRHAILKFDPGVPDPEMCLQVVSDREDFRTPQGLVPFVLVHLVLPAPVPRFAQGWELAPFQHLSAFDEDSDSPLALVGDSGALVAMPADLLETQVAEIGFQLAGEDYWITYSDGEVQLRLGEPTNWPISGNHGKEKSKSGS